MDYIKINVSDEQKNNLTILADFLERAVEPSRFDMDNFLDNKELTIGDLASNATPEAYNHCGTVACAVGHGPLAGLTPLEEEGWYRYTLRVFGADMYGRTNNSLMFEWLFGPYWANVDNTPQGASARINDFLENGGIPENWKEQYVGNEPLSYKVENV